MVALSCYVDRQTEVPQHVCMLPFASTLRNKLFSLCSTMPHDVIHCINSYEESLNSDPACQANGHVQ
jgi:hypothetical protein